MALFNPATALRAQLNSGYKNADYALSEIIDNSIEAGAKNIDLLIIQSQRQQGTRTVWRTNKVVVLDDGHGMPEGILNKALTFGQVEPMKMPPWYIPMTVEKWGNLVTVFPTHLSLKQMR